jgi:hypothetical protein
VLEATRGATSDPEGPRDRVPGAMEELMIGRIRHTRDPFWEDGQGARRHRRRLRVQGLIALAIAIVACGLTAAVWMRELAPLTNQLKLG